MTIALPPLQLRPAAAVGQDAHELGDGAELLEVMGASGYSPKNLVETWRSSWLLA
jgi:hypothetical protein